MGITTALLVLEGALCIYNPVQLRTRGNSIVLPANLVTRTELPPSDKLDPVVSIRRNNIGFRGPDLPDDFTDRVSLVVVGGSTSECILLSDGSTWPDLLSAKLDKELSGIWLNNAGLDGHSTFGHLHLLRAHLVGLKPKYILVYAGINDVDGTGVNKFDATIQVASASWPHYLAEKSELFCTLLTLWRTMRAKAFSLPHVWSLDLRGCAVAPDAPAVAEAYLARQRDVCLPGYRERLQALLEMATSAGITPILATQPSMYSDGFDPATNIAIGDLKCGEMSARTRARALAMFNDVTREIAAARSLLLIDVARDLPSDSRYFYDWTHYSKVGAEQVATIMAASLVPYLKARHCDRVR